MPLSEVFVDGLRFEGNTVSQSVFHITQGLSSASPVLFCAGIGPLLGAASWVTVFSALLVSD